MKANLFFLGTLLRTVFDSGKKQEQAISQLSIRLIDYDTRLPIVGANVSCVRDDFYESTSISIIPIPGILNKVQFKY